MKKYMLFDGNFDFDKFCDAVNSMKNEHSIFAHIVKDDDDCYICDRAFDRLCQGRILLLRQACLAAS